MNKLYRYSLFALVMLLAFNLLCLPQRVNARSSASGQPSAPVSGGTLRIPSFGQPVNLDPALYQYTYDFGIEAQIFEGLTQLDANNNVSPAIASSWSSPDAIEWTFNLRNDVYFHNGRQVKAADFVYSWNRAKTAGGAYASFFDTISTFTAPTDFTFIVTLTAPFVTFPVMVTMPLFAVIPSEAASTIGTNPIGAGPFTFVSWLAGNKIILQRYANYYDTPAYLDGLEYKFYADDAASWADFLGSNLDMAPIPSSQWGDTLKTNPNVVTGNVMATTFLGFNNTTFPDVRVRQAFQRAINRTAIASMSSYGSQPVANGIVSPTKGAYDNSDIVIPYDSAGALTLLAQAGWTDTNADGILDDGAGSNLNVSVYDSTSALTHAIALAVKDDLSNIGGAGVGAAVTLTTDRNAATVWRSAWMSDYPTPDNDLMPYKTGGFYAARLNYGSAAFDSYLNTALSTIDETARNAAFHAADAQLVLTDAAVLPLYYGEMTPLLKKSAVQGLRFMSRVYEILPFKYAWLDALTETTTVITADTPEPSFVNQSVTVTVSVIGATTPTGTVNIIGADTNCDITLDVNGQGFCNVVFTSNGAKTVAAIYNGDSTHNSSADAEAHVVVQTVNFSSSSTQDGWILESSEISNKGGTLDAKSTTFRLGDDAAKKQYLGILSFSTGAKLPDNAVITKVTLKVKKQGVVGGGNPVTTFQGFMVDVKRGAFGTAALQIGDFQAILGATGKTYGPFKPALVGGWYSINLTSAKAYINKATIASGLTQIRLRFKSDDNNNLVANSAIPNLKNGEKMW